MMKTILKEHKKGIVFILLAVVVLVAVAVVLTIRLTDVVQGSGKSGYVISKTIYYENGKKSHTTINDFDHYGDPVESVTDYETGFESKYVSKHSKSERSFDSFGVTTSLKGDGVTTNAYVESYNEHGIPQEIVERNGDIVTNTALEFYSSGGVRSVNEITSYSSGDTHVFHFEFDEEGMRTLYRSSFSDSDVGGETTYEYEKDESGNVIGCKETEHLPKSKQYKSGNAVVTGTITNYTFEHDDAGNIVRSFKEGTIDREFSYEYFDDLSEWAWLEANLFPPSSIG